MLCVQIMYMEEGSRHRHAKSVTSAQHAGSKFKVLRGVKKGIRRDGVKAEVWGKKNRAHCSARITKRKLLIQFGNELIHLSDEL
jgi:hypothetical protein